MGVPAFAPQFTVYVLPPSTVCLYSENRKFLLHGELYCALAAEIDGKRKLSDILGALRRRYSERDVRRALRRLVKRGFIVAPRLHDSNVALWANLGIAPRLAVRRLADCKVVIEDFGTKARATLARSLRRLGVRLSGRAAHRLTIALVTDYQDPRLVEFNRARLRKRESWVLVQPTGVVPLLGPRFKPEESACWECLAVRMRGNRGRRVSYSEHGSGMPGLSRFRCCNAAGSAQSPRS